MSHSMSDALEVAHAMADAARDAILPMFRTGLVSDDKGNGRFDPVTEADSAAEKAMRAVLDEHRPMDGILGEEFDDKPSQSGLTWVLDPIDGTRGFISGTPTWGVLIALSDDTQVHLGIIDQPYIGERFVGAGDQVAQMTGPLGPRPLKVRGTTSLAEATLFTTFPEIGRPEDRAGFERVADQVKLVRYGCDCYAYALLAAGEIDLVIEAGLAAYDIQGPIGVVEAAGGLLTNWEGGPALHGGRALAAATTDLLSAARALLIT